jgi:2-oxoacid:acceptor oxidoreductase gamma subunit (pyruvate/2-ketoisovalerate family)
MIEVRFHGRGGQGAVVASEILAKAAVKEGMFASAFPFFGVERRGAPVMAFCRIDDRPIRIHAGIYDPDHVVILDQGLIKLVDVMQGHRKEGSVVVNTAKTLTELVFGDERAYVRFDMSEFAEEHTGARLLGAPPGYIGYDAGGELTNAVREKPFSVVLFDEIEKAHPRILDKFLQILEDGRLTDGRGETAYFSEAILVFTSNLGIYVEDEHGRRVQNVAPDDPPEVVETRVRGAIQDYFKFRLSRPEILNRIGDNIVVFGFITPEVSAQIFDGMLQNVAARVRGEHKVELRVPDAVRERLRDLCTRDLANGGRGIGNRLESLFVNPLSRALFRFPLQGRDAVTVRDLVEDANRIMTVELE